jgi:hypothetical protein
MKTRHLPKRSHAFVANSFSSINCVTLLESRKAFESFRKDSAHLKLSEIRSKSNGETMWQSLKNCPEPIAGINIDFVGLLKEFYFNALDDFFGGQNDRPQKRS